MLPRRPPTVAVSRRGSAHPSSDPLRTVVRVSGEHDPATRTHLSHTIARAARLDDADVVVDLSDITFMDASTIGAIVEAHNQLRARRRSLTVRAPSPLARRLLDICRLAFLIDEPPRAVALDSWVAVPASDRAPPTTPALVNEPAPTGQPAHVEASRREAPARSGLPDRAPL